MQPDRPCYVRRAADDQLLETIQAQQFAYVLAPRATGKSSLMGRTIRRLRADGQQAAVIDLNQIAARSETVDSARWHYSIAYRICRELRLKVDLQAWWHDKNLLLSEQRLVEFFWDIVLARTQAPVTIFFDEAGRAIDLPFAPELFAAVHACYMRRVSEPDCARLNFVVLGTASRDRLCPDPNVSPFIAGRAIRLEDFTLDECRTLAPGFGQPEADAEAVLARIHAWTHGQPYLTQKLARGVARRGGRRLGDVDAVLHELFLAPATSREEPLLHHMQTLLAGTSPRHRQAVAMLGRLARGQEVIDDPSSAAQRLLDLAGLISSDDNGMLRFRNRIVERVFGRERTQRAEPARWRRPAAIAAALLAGLVLLPYWYARILPRADIGILESGTDPASVADAHRRLARLPGFGGRSDRLYADALARRSRTADSVEAVLAADAALRGLPDGDARADALLAAFWLRRAEAAAGRGERDEALVHALAAADQGSPAAAAYARELIDSDYRRLEQSLHLDAPVLAVAADWERDQAVIVDASYRVHHWPLSAGTDRARGASAVRTLPVPMRALRHVGVTRGFFVDEPGRAGALELRLTVEHGRPDDLLLRLRAPSGAAAELELPARAGTLEQFVFTATAGSPLARLGDESITGQWELTLFDRLSGETGRLLDWGLKFAGAPRNWDDAPVDGLPLPDPVRTLQIEVGLSADGRFGIAVPARLDARGAVTVWDLASGESIADLPLTAPADDVVLLGPDRVLIRGASRATLWDTPGRSTVLELTSPGRFTGRVVVSPDGGYFALGETAGDGETSIGLYRVDDGSRAARLTLPGWQDWVLAPDAAVIAGIDGSRRGRVIDPASGEIVTEFFHERELARMLPMTSTDRVLAVDRDGELFAWPLGAGQATLSPDDSIHLGTAAAPAGIGVAAEDGGLAFRGDHGHVDVVSPVDGNRQALLEHDGDTDLQAWLAPEADRLLTVSDSLVRYWQLDGETEPGTAFRGLSSVALDPAGGFGVLGFRGGEVRLLPATPDLRAAIERGSAAAAVTGHRGVVTSLAVSADGGLATSGGSGGVIRVWNTRTGSRDPAVLRHPPGAVHALAFSADGRWLVSAGETSARVFELASGDVASEIDVEGQAFAVAFSADGRAVAVGDNAGNITLASPDGSGGERRSRGGAPITALAFAGAADRLASGSRNGELLLWDRPTLSRLGSAHRFSGPIGWIGFSADTTRLHLRSGGWLHTLDVSGDSAQVTGSRLLPEGLRDEPALVLDAGGAIRALANAGGGRLAFGEFPVPGAASRPGLESRGADAGPDAGLDPGPGLPDRDFGRVLGLELDPETGTIHRFGL